MLPWGWEFRGFSTVLLGWRHCVYLDIVIERFWMDVDLVIDFISGVSCFLLFDIYLTCLFGKFVCSNLLADFFFFFPAFLFFLFSITCPRSWCISLDLCMLCFKIS